MLAGSGTSDDSQTYCMQTKPLYRRLRWCWLGMVTLILLSNLCNSLVIRADSNDLTGGVAWAAPRVTAVHRVGAVDTSQHQPGFLSNLDCTSLTYRTSASDVMHTGCFTETAFGLLDSDTDEVIFNGTDEGISLTPYWGGEVLVPWPKALGLLALDADSIAGSYLSLYKNPLTTMQDQRNGLGQLTGKVMTAGPELPLKDTSGKQLIINPQTMAFSNNGSWLVTETLNGSFVRINLATLTVTAFAPAFGSQGSPGLFQSQVAVSDDGQYVAIANKAAGSFKVYDLTTCGQETTQATQPYGCAWHDYSEFVGSQIDGFQTARHVRFVNDGLLSFEAQTSGGSNDGVYEVAPRDKISALIDYLALGDSYTSGEGAFDYLNGTDTSDDRCHLSAHSYPMLLSHDLFSETGGHSVACSGAVINDVAATSPDYRGQVRGVGTLQQLQAAQSALLNSIMASYTPGYVAQQRFVVQYQPSVMTLSVGGNDIGFGDMLQECVVPHVSLHAASNDCFSSYEDRLEVLRLIDRTVPRWTALYKQVQAEAPGAKLYVVGYPQVVYTDGDCALNVHLSQSELVFVKELTDYLNESIRQAASNAGATYVDISQALVGHRLCETASYNVAVNGLTAGTDAAVLGVKTFGKESYHPNALGQSLIEQAILEQTNNLSNVARASSGGSNSQAILSAPKTGRPVVTMVPDDNLTDGVARGGTNLTIQTSGAATGLKPNSTYSVGLDGLDGPVLSTTTSDNTGSVMLEASLPTSTASGSHTIDVTGVNQTGEIIDVRQPIYVAASDNDADGDGIPDVLDTCPGAVNSSQDVDHDGIDDSCDPIIGSTSDGGSAAGSGNFTVSIGSIVSRVSNEPVDLSSSWRPLSGVNWLLLVPVLIWLRRFVKAKGRHSLPGIQAVNVSKLRCLPYNKLMIWVRKGLVHLLSLLLLLSLIGVAGATSASLNLTHPTKLEAWLDQSNFYNSLVTSELHDAQQSATNDIGAGRVSLGDPTVQSAVRAVFTPQLLKQYTGTVLNSNYAWLEGKTSSPTFKIDLTQDKQQLAQQVGQSVQARLDDLPPCSAAQLAQLQTTLDSDPLSIPCLLPTLTPQAAAAQVTTQITESSDFLNNPVITAASPNPSGHNKAQPYYQRLSVAPKLYRWGQRLPSILGGVALVSVIGIFFIAPTRRRALRRIGVVLLEAGIVLLVVKFVSDTIFNRLENHIFNSSNGTQLQHALTDFLHRLESQLIKVDLWFAIGFIVVAVLILGRLWLTRDKSPKSPQPPRPSKNDGPSVSTGGGRPAVQPGNNQPLPPFKQPPRPKRPRLIQ
jgi:hypothetical protein